LAAAETVEQLVRQDQLATTRNSHLLLLSVVAAAGRTTQAQPQAVPVPEVAQARRATSLLDPTAQQGKALRVEIRPLLTTQPMEQAVVDREAWAKMAYTTEQ
jgi:hypothetical protein